MSLYSGLVRVQLLAREGALATRTDGACVAFVGRLEGDELALQLAAARELGAVHEVCYEANSMCSLVQLVVHPLVNLLVLVRRRIRLRVLIPLFEVLMEEEHGLLLAELEGDLLLGDLALLDRCLTRHHQLR